MEDIAFVSIMSHGVRCFVTMFCIVTRLCTEGICDAISICMLFCHVFVGCICRACWRIYVFFFFTLVKHSCVVSVNSVSDAFSTNQKIDLFVTLVTLDVR